MNVCLVRLWLNNIIYLKITELLAKFVISLISSKLLRIWLLLSYTQWIVLVLLLIILLVNLHILLRVIILCLLHLCVIRLEGIAKDKWSCILWHLSLNWWNYHLGLCLLSISLLRIIGHHEGSLALNNLRHLNLGLHTSLSFYRARIDSFGFQKISLFVSLSITNC